MEVNAANVAWHKIFVGSQVSLTKKWTTTKTNSVSCLLKKYKKLRTMPSQEQQKGHNIRNENIQRYVSVKFPVKVVRFQSHDFKYEHRDLTHSWRLRNNNFYLIVTEWLASPGGTKFSKPIEEMSKEELNVFLKSFCTSARKKDGLLSVCKSSSMKSIWEPPLIVFFARCRSTNRFPLSLTPRLLRQIRH